MSSEIDKLIKESARMERTYKKLSLNIVIICLLVLAAGMATFAYLEVKKEGGKCIYDPLVYGAKSLSEANNAELSCTCSLNKPNTALLLVNSSSKRFERYSQVGSQLSEVNWSDFQGLLVNE